MAAVTSENSPASSVLTPPIALYGVFVAALILLLHPTAFDMAAIWATSSSYTHGFLVAPIAVWMIARHSAYPAISRNRLAGYVIVIAGAGLWLLGRAAGVALIELLALVTALIGGAGVFFGAGALRAWAYPLAFLYFMVPFGETIVPALQTATAEIVVALLGAISMPVTLDGYLIRTPAGAFEVAEACAGFRFLIAALMLAAIFAYVSFASWRKRLLFLLFAAAFAILANGARAFLLVLIATLTDKQWAVGPDHLLFGWVFYALLLVVLITIGRRYADAPRAPHMVEEKPAPGPASIAPLMAALAVIAAVAAYAGGVVDRPLHRTAPASLSLLNAPGWRILPPAENWRAHLPQADRTAGATYANAHNTVYLSLGYFTHDRRGGEIINYDNRAWGGAYWRHIGEREAVIYLFGTTQKRRLDILAGPERRRLAAVTVYWLDGQIYFERWRMKLAQMKAKLRGENPPGGMIVMAAAYRRDPAEAIAAIRAFTSDVEPIGVWLLRNDRS